MITQSAYLLIAAGAFVFVVSFLGYCGAVKESRVLLGLVTSISSIKQLNLFNFLFELAQYGAFVLIVVALEITAGSLAATYQQEVMTKPDETHPHSFN